MYLREVRPDDWAAVRTNFQRLGSIVFGSGATPPFAGVELTGLTASTLVGVNASKITESVTIGTGLDYTRPTLSLSHLGVEALTDPGADRIFFWDDSETASKWLTVSTGLQISTTNITTKDSEIVHDNLSGFVANEHIDHTSVTLTAGTGLTGGGDISTNRTFAVDGVLEDLDTLGANSADSEFLVGTGAGALAWESGATVRTSLGLTIGTNVQAHDAGLDSLAALTVVSDSVIKATATDTYEIRTLAEIKSDLSLNLVENTALSTWAGTTNITTLGTIGTGTWQGTSISTTYTDAKCTDATADNTATNETSHADVVVDGDFTSNGLMERTGAGSYGIKVIGTDVQAFGAILDDLNILGANSADSEFLVGTGAGALAWESGATARTSIGLGTTNNPQFAGLGIGVAATAGTMVVRSVGADGEDIFVVERATSDLLVLDYLSDSGTDSTTLRLLRGGTTMIQLATKSTEDTYFNMAGKVGIGTSTPTAKLEVYDNAINTTADYVGFHNYHQKTAGVTDTDDDIWGIYNETIYNQNGGIIGQCFAEQLTMQHIDGDIGDVSTSRSAYSCYYKLDLDGGKVWGSGAALTAIVDQEAGHEVVGSVFGAYIMVDADGTVGGSVYGLYIYNLSNVDYGIYQVDTAMNSLGGPLSLRTIKSGATQAAAGAAANEIWKTNGHASLPNNVLMIGV